MEEKNYTVLSFLYGSGFARLNGIGELEVLQEYFFFSRGKLVHLFDDVNRDRVKTESVKVYELIHDKKIKGFLIGRKFRVLKKEVILFINTVPII